MHVESHAPVTAAKSAGPLRPGLAGDFPARDQIVQFGKLTRNGNFHVHSFRQE
jgi:hypothetical protein